MVPYAIHASDALFNLGFACACAQTLPPGVWLAMNGRVLAGARCARIATKASSRRRRTGSRHDAASAPGGSRRRRPRPAVGGDGRPARACPRRHADGSFDGSFDGRVDVDADGRDARPVRRVPDVARGVRHQLAARGDADGDGLEERRRPAGRLCCTASATSLADRQTGPRGDRKTFTETMAMGMAQQAARRGHAGPTRPGVARSDGWARAATRCCSRPARRPTATDTARRPPASARRVHGAVGETYSLPLGDERSGVRLRGTCPASRRSGRRPTCIASPGCAIPQAPLTHHWFDSTHITFGVVTARRQPGTLEARSVVVQRPRARRASLEHRDAALRLVVDAPVVQPDARTAPFKPATAI